MIYEDFCPPDISTQSYHWIKNRLGKKIIGEWFPNNGHGYWLINGIAHSPVMLGANHYEYLEIIQPPKD